MGNLFKRTKILATVGPAVFAEEKLRDMVNAGANGFRFNFSHGTNEERDGQINLLRKFASERGKSIAIVQDLQGPKIRLGDLKDNHFEVKAGDELYLESMPIEHDGGKALPVQYNLAEKVRVGEPVLLFDGKVETETIDVVSPTAIKVRVKNDGYLMSRKGINLPDTDMGGDVITDKDRADIEYGASRDFDYVAMSFVQSADDIDHLRQIMVSFGSTARVIAKIETKRAVADDVTMEAIVRASDGIMVARGDLAYEAGTEVVPIVERKLIALCRQYAKICIVATQMMGSMVENPHPTRAEVSDVATAVLLGADAVMLSDETSNGKYPIESIKEMKKVILYTQDNSRIVPLSKEVTGEYVNYDAISQATVRLAEKINADLIAVGTKSGATAYAIASQRPNVPMVSVTSNPRVAGQLALIYANSAYVRPYADSYTFDLVQELKNNGYLKLREGQNDLTVVFVSGLRDEEGGTNTIEIRKV